MRQVIANDATLELRISFAGLPPADQIATILDALNKAFEGQSLSAELVIEQISIGSLAADFKVAFEVGAAVATVAIALPHLVEFMERAASALAVILEASGNQIPHHISVLLRALAVPVATEDARDSRLSIAGDNNTIIIIGIEEAKTILNFGRIPEEKEMLVRWDKNRWIAFSTMSPSANAPITKGRSLLSKAAKSAPHRALVRSRTTEKGRESFELVKLLPGVGLKSQSD